MNKKPLSIGGVQGRLAQYRNPLAEALAPTYRFQARLARINRIASMYASPLAWMSHGIGGIRGGRDLAWLTPSSEEMGEPLGPILRPLANLKEPVPDLEVTFNGVQVEKGESVRVGKLLVRRE